MSHWNENLLFSCWILFFFLFPITSNLTHILSLTDSVCTVTSFLDGFLHKTFGKIYRNGFIHRRLMLLETEKKIQQQNSKFSFQCDMSTWDIFVVFSTVTSKMLWNESCSELERPQNEKVNSLRGIRTTHLLLSGQSSYPIRLEETSNLRLMIWHHSYHNKYET